MKKFMWNTKFKWSLFTKKEKIFFPVGLITIVTSIVFVGIAMRPVYYEVKFYDKNNLLESHQIIEGTKIELTEYKPSTNIETFYGWSKSNDSSDVLTYEVINGDEQFYGVWGEFEEVVTKETIEFIEIKEDDESIYKGETVVSQEGSGGIKEIIRRNFVVAGTVINSDKIEERITKEPQDRIVLVGTKEKEVVKAPTTFVTNTSNSQSKVNNSTSQSNNSGTQKKEPIQETPKEEKVYAYGIKVIPNKYNDKFKNCTQLKTIYPLGVPKGHPAYENYRGGDRDKDGWACEGPETPGPYYEANN